jgi:hypothetical protein
MKICPVRVELFRADGPTDIHDEVNSRFSQFCERAQERVYIAYIVCSLYLALIKTVSCVIDGSRINMQCCQQ